ncbi:RNA-directed DNA polymerase from mobile element jockey [Stylophora pistillata]|uniref:RNA-directed DNA polymerase from mobile element jockey n=1 Tax=Stylophora pistillata TaxID=50429 RepID=A0A2B4SKR1_STYPI|nr:RNA-directed DNA polymerase from mobile element jockey [Stylophora pistillata]
MVRGSYSDWSPVTSGVPQGSVLGPVMFLIYVNEIPGIITSTAKLFADDTKIYRQINNIDDSIALQIDLTTLDLWADRWQMKFNSTKCEVMRITHNRDKKSTRYNISSTVLRNVSNYKDLGVIMTSDLKWSKHVEQIVHKANKVLGLLKRTVGGKNKDIFSNLYKTLVRPILEYACPVWSPHLIKDIDEIEKIQRRASRIALGQRRQEMAYTESIVLEPQMEEQPEDEAGAGEAKSLEDAESAD